MEAHGLTFTDVVYYNFKIIPAPFDRMMPGLTTRLAARLERLGRGPLRWLATGFIVKVVKG